MNESGFIVISRKLMTWKYNDYPAAMTLWIHILLMSNWKESYFFGEKVERGELITSVSHLMKATGIRSNNTIRKWLKRFADDEMIELQSTNRYTRIKVINYALFQDVPKEYAQRSAQRTAYQGAQRSAQRTAYNRTNKQENKGTNKKDADVWDTLDLLYQRSKDCYSPFNDQDIMDKVDQAHDFMVKTVHNISGPLSMNSLQRSYEIAEDYFIDNNPDHITNPGAYITKILKLEQVDDNATDNAE